MSIMSDDSTDFPKFDEAWLDEMLSRPSECLELSMELGTAIRCKDVAGCAALLREKGKWLSEFKSHELAELMDAAIKADTVAEELLDLLIDSGVPADPVYDYIGDMYQHTPLITAACHGRLDLIQKLIAAGANLHWKSPRGANALSAILPSNAPQAPTHDTSELAAVREWLVSQGLRIDPLCPDSRRKLSWASCQPDSWQDVLMLLELGIPLDETGWSPFMLDLATGRVDLRAVANLSEDDLRHTDAWDRTPLLLAISAGRLDIASALMERGADVNARAHCGATALHLAAKHNHCDVIIWLLENGFELDVRDDFGHSALNAAVGANRIDAASLLIRMGADPCERDENGYSLIHHVWMTDDFSMLKLLAEAGSKVNDVSGGGTWPLFDACEEGNLEAVKYLLEKGADPNLTSTGQTALFKAVLSDNMDCVRLLVDAGADLNATDCDGWTCLFYLSSEAMAYFLLEHGAKPEIQDNCGDLAEDWHRIPIPVRSLLKKRRLQNDRSQA